MATDVENLGEAQVAITGDLEPLQRAFDEAKAQAGKAADEISKKMREGLETINRISLVASAAFAAIGGFALKASGEMETYHNTLKTVLKSEERAVEMLDWAKRLAAETPFEIPQIVEATARLESYGMSAKQWLTTIGDMAAVMNRDIVDAVEAVADAMRGEMERLKEFGVTKEMIAAQGQNLIDAKGQILDYAAFAEATMKLIQERFGGGMKDMMQSWRGMTSNFGDAMGTVLRDIGDRLLPAAKGVVSTLTTMLNGFNSLPGPIKDVAAAATVAAGAFSMFSVAITAVMLNTEKLAAAWKILQLAMGPAGWVTLVVTGLGAIAMELFKVSENARKATTEIARMTDATEVQKQIKYWEDEVKRLEDLKKASASASEGVKKAVETVNQNMDWATETVSKMLKKENLSTTPLSIDKELDNAKQQLAAYKKRNEELANEGKKTAQTTRSVADVTAEMNKALEVAALKERALGDAFDFNQAKLSILTSALEGYANVGGKDAQKAIDALIPRIQRLSAIIEEAGKKSDPLKRVFDAAAQARMVLEAVMAGRMAPRGWAQLKLLDETSLKAAQQQLEKDLTDVVKTALEHVASLLKGTGMGSGSWADFRILDAKSLEGAERQLEEDLKKAIEAALAHVAELLRGTGVATGSWADFRIIDAKSLEGAEKQLEEELRKATERAFAHVAELLRGAGTASGSWADFRIIDSRSLEGAQKQLEEELKGTIEAAFRHVADLLRGSGVGSGSWADFRIIDAKSLEGAEKQLEEDLKQTVERAIAHAADLLKGTVTASGSWADFRIIDAKSLEGVEKQLEEDLRETIRTAFDHVAGLLKGTTAGSGSWADFRIIDTASMKDAEKELEDQLASAIKAAFSHVAELLRGTGTGSGSWGDFRIIDTQSLANAEKELEKALQETVAAAISHVADLVRGHGVGSGSWADFRIIDAQSMVGAEKQLEDELARTIITAFDHVTALLRGGVGSGSWADFRIIDSASLAGAERQLEEDLKQAIQNATQHAAELWRSGLGASGSMGDFRILEQLSVKGYQNPAEVVLSNVNEQLDLISRQAAVYGKEFDAVAAKSAVLRKAIDDLLAQGYTPESQAVRRLKEQLDDLTKSTNPLKDAFNALAGWIGGKLVGGMPVINAAIQGAQAGAAGGPVGMAVGALVGVLSESKQFGELLAVANHFLGKFADMLGMVLEPFMPLIELVGVILTPLMAVFGTMLKNLVLPALKALFPVFKFLGELLLEVLIGLANVYNDIMKALGGIFKALSNWEIFGAKPLSFLGGVGDFFLGLQIDTTEYAKALQELQGLTWEEAMARAKEIAAIEKTTEALRNAPSGFKIAAYRWAAAEPLAGAGYGSVSGASLAMVVQQPSQPGRPGGRYGTEPPVQVIIQGDVYGFDDFAKKVEQANMTIQRRKGIATYGTPAFSY